MEAQEKQKVINEAVNKGFIRLKNLPMEDEFGKYDGNNEYEAAKEFLTIPPKQRSELSSMSRMADLF